MVPEDRAVDGVGFVRVGRWMSRSEYDAMVASGRVQPTLTGLDAKSVTKPPAPDAYRAATPGSLFVEFDVPVTHLAQGGNPGWAIAFGPNSVYGRLASKRGQSVDGMPPAVNIAITARK